MHKQIKRRFLACHATETDDDDYRFLETTMLGNISGTASDEAFEKNYIDAVETATEEFRQSKDKAVLIDVISARKEVNPVNLPLGDCG